MNNLSKNELNTISQPQSYCIRYCFGNQFYVQLYVLAVYIQLIIVRVMFENFLRQMPPVTKIIMGLQLIGLLCLSLQLVDRYDFYFNFDKILYQGQIRYKQVWRLFTCLFFFKKMSLFLLFEMLFVYHMLKNLQRGGFGRGSVDFLYIVSVIQGILYGLAWAYSINHLGVIFKYTIYYLYGRTNYEHIIHINLIPIRAPFLIWLLFLIDWIMDTPQIKNLFISILLGHTLFFVLKVYPKLYFSRKKTLLQTPQLFVDVVSPFFSEEDMVQRQFQDQFW